MKICIDVSSLILNRASGLKTFTKTLVNGLLEIDQENEYILFYNYFLNRHKLQIPKWNNFKNYKNVVCRIPRKILIHIFWKNFKFPNIEYFSGKVDIFHSLHIFLPPTKGKKILTIHDCREFYFDKYKIEEDNIKMRIKSIKIADYIIAISESTKQDIIKFLNVNENKIFVIYNDLNNKFCKIDDQDKLNETLKKYKTEEKYLLYVGNLESRKNVSGLIDAFFLFKEKYKTEHRLVIAGGIPTDNSNIKMKVEENKFKNDIIFIPYLSDENLVCFYNKADCFVFVSFYEGFGLPPLEAMACGCPVVASNTSSIPEVVGDAGILVDPKNIEEIADAIWKVISDNNLRKNLIERGLQRAEIFKQKNMAKKTLEVYKKVLNA